MWQIPALYKLPLLVLLVTSLKTQTHYTSQLTEERINIRVVYLVVPSVYFIWCMVFYNGVYGAYYQKHRKCLVM